jgi:hypothetical protein
MDAGPSAVAQPVANDVPTTVPKSFLSAEESAKAEQWLTLNLNLWERERRFPIQDLREKVVAREKALLHRIRTLASPTSASSAASASSLSPNATGGSLVHVTSKSLEAPKWLSPSEALEWRSRAFSNEPTDGVSLEDIPMPLVQTVAQFSPADGLSDNLFVRSVIGFTYRVSHSIITQAIRQLKPPRVLVAYTTENPGSWISSVVPKTSDGEDNSVSASSDVASSPPKVDSIPSASAYDISSLPVMSDDEYKVFSRSIRRTLADIGKTLTRIVQVSHEPSGSQKLAGPKRVLQDLESEVDAVEKFRLRMYQKSRVQTRKTTFDPDMIIHRVDPDSPTIVADQEMYDRRRQFEALQPLSDAERRELLAQLPKYKMRSSYRIPEEEEQLATVDSMRRAEANANRNRDWKEWNSYLKTMEHALGITVDEFKTIASLEEQAVAMHHFPDELPRWSLQQWREFLLVHFPSHSSISASPFSDIQNQGGSEAAVSLRAKMFVQQQFERLHNPLFLDQYSKWIEGNAPRQAHIGSLVASVWQLPEPLSLFVEEQPPPPHPEEVVLETVQKVVRPPPPPPPPPPPVLDAPPLLPTIRSRAPPAVCFPLEIALLIDYFFSSILTSFFRL